ncbi:SIP domain-containing protein [Gordonia sp. VNK21]|uniref:SIP domain-containing protein n=1 Tax=Gordonia sp. VNK21 TaxID=3382483 RepID=UPI0038D37815
MAKTLGFIADRIAASGYATEVVARERLSESLVRLIVRCPAFAGAEITPGAATSWRVSRADFRHYTPAVIDGDALSVIIALHGSGEGERLLLGLQPGDELTVLKWAVKRSFAWQDGDRPIVVVGDGTVISLAMQFERRIGDSGRGFRAVLEVPEADREAVHALVRGAETVARTGTPGAGLDAYLASATFTGDEIFYLAGHGQSIQRQRDLLRSRFGIDRKAVRTQPFWADGKVGL